MSRHHPRGVLGAVVLGIAGLILFATAPATARPRGRTGTQRP